MSQGTAAHQGDRDGSVRVSANRSDPSRSVLSPRFQHDRVAFVAGNNAVKLLQVVGVSHRNAKFLHFQRAAVVDYVACDLGLRMVTGEAVFSINGRRHVVDYISFWDRDLETIGVARRTLKFDRELSRLFRFENPAALYSEHAWTDQQQSPGILGVVLGLK